ncbi:MAG TPA: hypothetical protein HPP83_02050 [Candidatus Hydrogenedentes bacterium]|nr:hypothetical protein [Candidatus Hydrogenedentota bacterium]
MILNLFAAVAVGLQEARGLGGTLVVGDDDMQVTVAYSTDGLAEIAFSVCRTEIRGLTGSPWLADTSKGAAMTSGNSVELVEADASKPHQKVVFSGEGDHFGWMLKYEVTGPGRITKFLSLTAQTGVLVERIFLWHAQSKDEPAAASTGLQDIAAFYRHGNHGLFVSLDFPYSRVVQERGWASVGYPPHIALEPGQSYLCHSLTFGATRLTGEKRYGHDLGEVQAMDSYVQERFEPRFCRPMFVGCAVMNRYCQVTDKVVWYTYKDHPTLCFNTDLMKRHIEMLARLNIEYYNLLPGVFDWGPDDPKPEVVQDMVAHAKRCGVRVGDYSGASYVVPLHFNDYENSVGHPEWRMRDGNDNRRDFYCFGETEFVDFYIDTVVSNVRRFGYELHNLDFLFIEPCYAKSHSHPPGEDGVYHQLLGVIRLMEAVASTSPEMLIWSNSGNWSEFFPKIAWWNPNIYVTDPLIDTSWQGLNMTRLSDDARREQMVSLHYARFLPYRFFTNCQYFFCQNSVVPEIRNYQYGALSTLAVTPNLSLCEIRPWLEELSTRNQERVFAFYKKWTDFIKDHFDLWKKTYHVGDNPGFGGIEVYGHAEDNHGYVFLVNPQYWDRVVEVPLGPDLGFGTEGECELVELYPTEQLRLTNQGPYVSLGSRVPIRVPAQQVLVIEVRPAPECVKAPRLYGLPGTVEETRNGYLLKTRGEQGQTKRAAVLLPPGSRSVVGATVRRDVPKQPQRDFFETGLTLAGSSNEGVLLDITFRRTPRPTELRQWRVREGSLEEGVEAGWTAGFEEGEELRFPLFINIEDESIEFPLTETQANALGLGPLANFCGAYIDNAFYEMQETWIELATGDSSEAAETALATDLLPERPRPLHPQAKSQGTDWWVQTSFHLPFMYTLGFEPFLDKHTILAIPLLSPSKVKRIEGWINGQPLEVQRYRYPRNPKLSCYWADLVGSGTHGGRSVWDIIEGPDRIRHETRSEHENRLVMHLSN